MEENLRCFGGNSRASRLVRYFRTAASLTLLAGLASVSLPASEIIQYQVTDLGPYLSTTQHELEYSFTLSGINLLDNGSSDYELDINFDQGVFSQVCLLPASPCTNTGPVAGNGVSLAVLNSPPGDPIQYSIVATVNDPSLTGTFDVAAVLSASGAVPPSDFTNPLLWYIVDDDNGFVQISSGEAVPLATAPEPSTFSLYCLGLLAGGEAVRRRLARRTSV